MKPLYKIGQSKKLIFENGHQIDVTIKDFHFNYIHYEFVYSLNEISKNVLESNLF